MQDSIKYKLENLVARHEELSALMSEPEIVGDRNKFRDLSKEYAQLGPLLETFASYNKATQARDDAKQMLQENDAELKAMAEEEIAHTTQLLVDIEQELHVHLLPKDPNDEKNIFIEIRAGTGGDEAAIFAGDLFRMYSRYAESRKWSLQILSENQGEHGGYKEIIARLAGDGAYSRLKFEMGAHRVQRVPETESQGRVHTSACTVAILPEAEEIDTVDINPVDLKIDTYRSSGAGGQHVNTTDSAIRITHLPTGIVVECQDERSQHKNKAKALSLLSSRILQGERDKAASEQAETRRLQVGSGDRSQRIRTYNFPQGRVTDHRIGLTLYKLGEVMVGELDQVIDPLIQEHQTDLLADLSKH